MSLIYTPKPENGRKNMARPSRLLLFLSALWGFFRLLVVLLLGMMSLPSQPANAQKSGDWHPDLDAYDMGQAQVALVAKPRRTTVAAPKPKRQAIFVPRTVRPKALPVSRVTALESSCVNNSLDDITDFFNPLWMPLARLRNLASDTCRHASPPSATMGKEPTGGVADRPEYYRFSRDAWDDGDCNLADEMNDTAVTDEDQAAERRESAASLGSFSRQVITSPFPLTDGNPF
jgi:hypothetical protein